MTASDWTMQFLADILGAPVDRPVVLETTALGAAYLAGLQAGLLPKPEIFAKTWKRQKRFMPKMDAATRAQKRAGWAEAVQEASGVKWRRGTAPFLIHGLKAPSRAEHCNARGRGFPSRGFARNHR